MCIAGALFRRCSSRCRTAATTLLRMGEEYIHMYIDIDMYIHIAIYTCMDEQTQTARPSPPQIDRTEFRSSPTLILRSARAAALFHCQRRTGQQAPSSRQATRSHYEVQKTSLPSPQRLLDFLFVASRDADPLRHLLRIPYIPTYPDPLVSSRASWW